MPSSSSQPLPQTSSPYARPLRCASKTVTAICLTWSLVYACVGSTSRGKKWYGTIAGKFFDDAKGGIPVLTLAIPLLLAASTCALLLLAQPARATSITKKGWLCNRGGEVSFNKISFFLFFLPTIAFLLATIERHIHKRRRLGFLLDDDLDGRGLHEGHEHHAMAFDKKVMEIGNAFGMAALIAFSFFLVPVTKHSPLIILMDWNPIRAATVHVWSGRTAAIGVAVHGAMHMYRWAGLLGEDLVGLMMFPPAGCWGSGLVPTEAEGDEHWDESGHESREHDDVEEGEGEHNGGRLLFRGLHEGHEHGDAHGGCRRGLVASLLRRSLHEGHDDDHDDSDGSSEAACVAFQPTCADSRTDCSCYHHFRNFTGFLALVFLVVILLSSLGPVRRRWYRAFYVIHIVSGPFVFLFCVMHYHRAILYMCPSLLYYLACSVPAWVRAWSGRWCCTDGGGGGGTKIVSVREIESADSALDSGSERRVVDIILEASPEAVRGYRSGQYVRICAPSISSVWHPFTANTVLSVVPGGEGGPTTPSEERIRILFRATGPFTRRLAADLVGLGGGAESPSSPPLLLADGFHGQTNRLEQALSHDAVVIAAGGIGITPYLSLLGELRSALAARVENGNGNGDGGAATTKLLDLHWSCRDRGLVDFVKAEYFDPLLAAGCGCVGEDGAAAIRIHIHLTGAAASPSYSDEPEPGQEKPDTDPEVDAENANNGTNGEESWPSNPFGGEGGAAGGSSDPLPKPDSSSAIAVDGPGSPFVASRFAPAAKDSVFGNFPYLLTFGSIAWAGLAVIWRLYLRAMRRDDEVLPRAWGLVAVAVVSLLVSLVANFVMDSTDAVVWGGGIVGRRKGKVKVKFSRVAEDEPAEEVELATVTGKKSKKASSLEEQEGAALGQAALDAPTFLTMSDSDDSSIEQGSTNVNGVMLEISRGRPDLYQIFERLDGASNPALFLCGPIKMIAQIRSAARGKCGGCCPSSTSIYEEAFEL